MNLLANNSFKELLVQRGLKPAAFDTSFERMEASEIMAMVTNCGDQVLALARRGQISTTLADTLLVDLTKCFVEPISHAKRVIEISKELREYKQ